MNGRLLWKLLAINATIVAVVIVAIWIALDYLAADYFTELMARYHISPTQAHAMFVASVHWYLIQTSLTAFTLAAMLSFWLTHRVLRPLTQLAEVTRRIAAGDYSARVETSPDDELGELGQAFNRMGDSLERIERLRKTMVIDFAHELCTPLTNIRGYLEALADGVIAPSTEVFDMLQEEILQLVRLIEDLQQLTKVEAAAAYLCRQRLYLPQLVDSMLERYDEQFRSRGIDVATRFAPDAQYVLADRDKLLQVLRNLIQNAWQYTPRGGSVHIGSSRTADGVRVASCNDGDGIGTEHLPYIFERFYRADGSRSRRTGGSGLGLAIVKELVEAHGGRVGATSTHGHTEVWFSLPGFTKSLNHLEPGFTSRC